MGVIPQPDDPSECPHCGGPKSACVTIASHPYMDEIARLLENMPDCVEKDAIAWAHSQIERSASDLATLARTTRLMQVDATGHAATAAVVAASKPHHVVHSINIRSFGVLAEGLQAIIADDFGEWSDRKRARSQGTKDAQ